MGESLGLPYILQLENKCSHGRIFCEDRISTLSDDILLFILSFMTFKEVVKTGLISRRWMNLWTHTLALHLHMPAPKYPQIFDWDRNYVKWVNRILQRHKGQYLTEFKIVHILDGGNQKDIDNWLEFAFKKKVQCLELNLLVDGIEPCRPNTSNNYVLTGPFLSFGSKNLSCLKSLSLKRVDVSGDAISFLLLKCPFLERLEVVASRTLANLVISDPTLVLKYLSITFCFALKVLSVSNFNLVSLDISEVEDLNLTHLPMLVEFFLSGSSHKLSRSISQASSCFAHLEAFTLEGRYLKDAIQLSNYNQLTKLKRLVIIVRADAGNLSKLISVINACPRLEEFVFKLIWYEVPRSRITRMAGKNVSSLKNTSLKVFEFVGYQNQATDNELILCVLKNCDSLEKIIIDPHVVRGAKHTSRCEEEARSNALLRILRKYIPERIQLLLRNC